MSAATPWSYDRIAALYATDMGQNMRHDDVGCYRRLALQRPGRVLELGCGSGRILLPLCAAGIDIVGVDRSLPMLQVLRAEASQRGLKAPVAQMDLGALALHGRFALILAAYSVLTYLRTPAALAAVLARLTTLLQPAGVLVLDAFIPRPLTARPDYQDDYHRAHGSGWLQRSKRITVLADGCHRIERRYRLLDAAQQELDCFTTEDVIRPLAPEVLRRAVADQGLQVEAELWDYGTRTDPAQAQFYTLVAAPRR